MADESEPTSNIDPGTISGGNLDDVWKAIDQLREMIQRFGEDITNSINFLTEQQNEQRLHIEEIYRRLKRVDNAAATSSESVLGLQCAGLLGTVTSINFEKPLTATINGGTLTVGLATVTKNVVKDGACVNGAVTLNTIEIKVIDPASTC